MNANPDGYTVLQTSVSIAINPAIYKKMPYDTLKDLTPVTILALGSTGYLLLANPSSAARSELPKRGLIRVTPEAVSGATVMRLLGASVMRWPPLNRAARPPFFYSR